MDTRPVERSKWFRLVKVVAQGQTVQCRGGGKEVHAADVAGAVDILLTAKGVAGEAYNCCDMYISQYDVARLAKQITGSQSEIVGEQTHPKHEIVTDKIHGLGMTFGGRQLLFEFDGKRAQGSCPPLFLPQALEGSIFAGNSCTK